MTLEAGRTDRAVTVPVSGLTAGRKYYFRLVAVNVIGTANGSGKDATLLKPAPTPDTLDGTVSCVEVRLKSPAGSRRRIDGSTGRAPDRAKPGSADARNRADTGSVDLTRGFCQRLRTNFYR